jgi:hypothetical protein
MEQEQEYIGHDRARMMGPCGLLAGYYPCGEDLHLATWRFADPPHYDAIYVCSAKCCLNLPKT